MLLCMHERQHLFDPHLRLFLYSLCHREKLALLPKGFQQIESPLADRAYVVPKVHQAFHHYLKVGGSDPVPNPLSLCLSSPHPRAP